MTNLQLHPKSLNHLKLLAKRQPQAIILHGKKGIGLYTIAKELAKQLSDINSILHILPDEKNNIKIDIIRQLYSQTRTKRPSKLIVLIDDAEAMLVPAQNALLKLLEDTPKDTIFILTSHHPQLLLPTIRSRVQEIEILPVPASQTLNTIKKHAITNKAKVAQLLFLSQGLPAELHRLVHNEEYLSLRIQQMREAKNFLNAPLYEKLVIIHRLPKDRSYAHLLVQDLMRITETMLKSHTSPHQAHILNNLLETEQKLQNDGHIRTQLMNLAIKSH